MRTAVYLYVVGVLLAYALLVLSIRRQSEQDGQLYFVPQERIQYFAVIFSWVGVAFFAAAWLTEKLTIIYVYILFKYKVWKNGKKEES